MSFADVAQRLHDAAVAALATTGRPVARTWIAHGVQPAVECNNGLAVWLSNIALAKDWPTAWRDPIGCAPHRLAADATIWWVRPWPTTRPSPVLPNPGATAENAAATDLLADAEAMLTHLPGWNLDGSGDTEFRCLYGQLSPLAPSGGVAGWRWPLVVELTVP